MLPAELSGINEKLSHVPSQNRYPKKIIEVDAHVGMSKRYHWAGCRELGSVLERSRHTGIDWCIVSHLDALYEPERKALKANSQLLRSVERETDTFTRWV